MSAASNGAYVTRVKAHEVKAAITTAQRRALRERLVAEYEQEARTKAARVHRSLVCSDYDQHERCIANGPRSTGCLCECHDEPALTAPSVEEGGR